MKATSPRTPPVAILLLALAPAGAAGAAQTAGRIEKLLAQAEAADNLDHAEKKIDEAESQLKWAGRGMDARFLRADVLRTRGRVKIKAWQKHLAGEEKRAAGVKLLKQALDGYDALIQENEGIAKKIEDTTEGDPETNRKYREALSYRNRAVYAQAWGEYNLALGQAFSHDRKRFLDRAVLRFSHSTAGVTDAGGFEADGSDAKPIIIDCLLGQALCYYEQRSFADAEKYLNLAADGARKGAAVTKTLPFVVQRITYLRVKIHQDRGEHEKADEVAGKYFDALPGGHRLDALERGIAVERARSLAALADPQRSPGKDHRAFRARLEAAARTVNAYGGQWRAEMDRILRKPPGAVLGPAVARARELFNARRYRQAADAADAGLKDAKLKPPARAELRYIRFAAYWNLARWRDAHLAAAAFLRLNPTDPRAAHVCGKAIHAGHRALQASPPLPQADLAQFFDHAEKNFPTHPEVRMIPWYRGSLLLSAGEYARAERALSGVPPGSPAYRLAQYGMAMSAYKQAEALAGAKGRDAAGVEGHLSRAAQAVRRFAAALTAGQQLSPQEREAARKVIEVGQAAAQRMLNLPQPKPDAAGDLIRTIDALSIKTGQTAAAGLAPRILLSVRKGDVKGALKMIDAALANPGRDAGQLVQSLVAASGLLEQEVPKRIQAGKAAEAAALANKLVDIYRFLFAHVIRSTDKGVLAQERAVRRRLAAALQRVGRFGESIDHYEWLGKRLPRNESGDVIRGLGIAYEKTGKYRQAMANWGQLAGGLKTGTPGWCEACYHLIDCQLLSGQRDAARKRLAFFRAQYPNIADAEWKKRFDDLEARIGKGGK